MKHFQHINRSISVISASCAALLALAPLGVTAKSFAAEAFVLKLLRISGIVAAPGQQRSEDAQPGSIWLADIKTGVSQRLTNDGGYLSPVFTPDGRSVLALRGNSIVSLSLSGALPRIVANANNILKIVGFDSQSPQDVVLLLRNSDAPLASLSLVDGSVKTLPYDRSSVDQQRLLGQIRNQDRVYGDTSLFLSVERKEGLLRSVEWTDIYVARGNEKPRNISLCDGANCAQPALSRDGRVVVFVKSDEL